MAKILATAKQRGSVNAIVGAVDTLLERGHRVDIYATGKDNEAMGFGDRKYLRMKNPSVRDAKNALQGYDLLVVGLTGRDTADGTFTYAANNLGIASVGVNDQNSNYVERFGDSIEGIPQRISLMNDVCLGTIFEELPKEIAEAVKERSRVLGWTAFDGLYSLRERKSTFDKESFLNGLREREIEIPEKVYFHGTQNVPGTGHFGYEVRAAEEIMRTASNLGLNLVIKPHPGEESGRFSKLLAERYGHTFIPADSCDTKELMLASDLVTAGRSTMLEEACVLDINVGGIFTQVGAKELGECLEFYGDFWRNISSVASGAIPYVIKSEEIGGLFSSLATEDPSELEKLALDREKFSVDGKASERLADLVEETLNSPSS